MGCAEGSVWNSGRARWVGRGRIFILAVQGKLRSAPAGTGAPPLAQEQECQCWLLRGDGLWEVVAGTNYVLAARVRIIFSENQNSTNIVHTNWK